QQKLNEQLIVDVQEEIKRFKETNGIVPKNRKGKQKAIPETIPDTSRIGRFVKENLTQLERLRYRLQTIEDNYKYVSNLPDEELESHLGTEQQIAIRNFLIESKFSSEKVRKQFQDKYKELLASSLENQGKMHDDDEVEKRFVEDQKLIRGKPQPEPFPPEGATHNRYIPKENTYRERPVSPTSSEEDFNLKSRNIGEWLKSQAKEPPRPSSPIKDFVNKNINEINLEDDEEEFKLQKPPVRYKRTRTVVSTDTNLSSTNGDKWKRERNIRRKLFQESRKEEITSEDEKEMNELDNIIEDDVNDYYENKYNNQEEIGESSKPIRYENENTRILEIPWNGQTAQYPQNYESIQHEYESEKKEETNKGYGIVETDEKNDKGKQVDYKVFCNENTEIPPMNIGHIRIENSVENGYIGIIVQPGIANDNHIMIMNISSRNVKFNKGQYIGNVEKIQKNDEIFLTKLPDLKDQSEKEKERILILRNQCEMTGGPGTWEQIGHILTEYVDVFREKQEYATKVNTDEIPPIELNLKNGMKENEIPMHEKRQALRKYSEEDKKVIKEMRDDLMKNNIIFSGNTEWGSSALVITKKDGTKKIAIDYRNLNKYLEQYREPLPDSKQMLQTVSRYKYYITMDIKSAYWQLVMHENSKKYTATTFAEYGTYCWHTLPFGISMAPAYLIRAMNKILGHLDYVVIYMDDF
ncbi:6216_t:CDS:2, partial [Cetraspora pellucida]